VDKTKKEEKRSEMSRCCFHVHNCTAKILKEFTLLTVLGEYFNISSKNLAVEVFLQ